MRTGMNKKLILSLLTVGLISLWSSMNLYAAGGTAKGEATDEKGQQGHGLSGQSQSSNVIMGGPEIVVGHITKIAGE